ncbi:MAG: anthranilate phosphoribosyltransferase [Chloroflexi bacterium]|nr:anthranilate phosphoribosyltransferase [Chloroflexota bacterium]MDA8189669.1 anthranilate phosphoribosyltransferase [Dehalococcoidales bacterium]
MIREAIAKLVSRKDLTAAEAEEVMQEIMHGDATLAQIGAFLVAFSMKGETVGEIAGFARAVRANAIYVNPKQRALLDTCGTGGDGARTFNISTTIAFVAAGAGQAVAKHGNRSASSQCGSADLLQALGVKLDLMPEQVAQCIDEVGLGFLFAPTLHPAFKPAVGPRKEVGVRTVFNILGPLCNPASAEIQIIGVYDPQLVEPVGGVLRELGTGHSFVVHGAGGLDEFSTLGPTKVAEIIGEEMRGYTLDAQELGLPLASIEDIRGGTPQENAVITLRILQGETGPRRDIVLLNAAAALVAGEKARDFKEGIALAAESIDTGRALAKMKAFVEFTNSFDEALTASGSR